MHSEYPSWFSCWLNFDEKVAYAVLIPQAVAAAGTIIIWEATGTFRGATIPGSNKAQRITSMYKFYLMQCISRIN